MNPLVKAIVMSLIRRALGYAGVAAAVAPGLADGTLSTGGVVLAAITALWSQWEKIRAARN